MSKITYTDMHIHSEFSMQDGAIRIADYDDPKHIKGELIKVITERNTSDTVTVTDHGNMQCHALLASVCKTFGLKHIPGCEFYIAKDTRHDKSYSSRSGTYMHINAWAKNKKGYSNMCNLQKLSYEEGFYYVPRIDKELIEKYHDGIVWSDACVGGTISSFIGAGEIERAYQEFMWYLNLIGDDFYIEYHNHGIPLEDECNKIKIEWANKHGVPIIACTDSHFTHKEDKEAHRVLLCTQYGKQYNDPSFTGFSGDGYWIMSEDELLDRFPKEYLDNTQLIVNKCDGNIIEFGDVIPPQFKIPQSFIDSLKENS